MLKMKKEKILVICAHNDDQIIGCGGTFAKYVREGKIVKTIVFAYGEKSHPHYKPQIIKKQRVKEAIESDKILKGKGIKFLGLKDAQFEKEIKEKNIKELIFNLINKEKPNKIFTHSDDDFHPDHNSVYKLMKEMISEKKITCDVYTFDVWNIIKLKKRDLPKLVVDISDTYKIKSEALKVHKSQYNLPGIIGLRWRMFIHALINGLNHGYKYAEVFYKIK